MKFTVILTAVLTSLTSIASTKIIIDSQISPALSNIQEINRLALISSKFDPSDMINSELRLSVGGEVEGNICSFDKIAFHIQPEISQYNHKSVFDITAGAVKTSSFIDLEFPACPQISKPTWFSSTLVIQPQMWFESKKSHQWEYHFKSGSRKVATIKVCLDTNAGWSWQLINH